MELSFDLCYVRRKVGLKGWD